MASSTRTPGNTLDSTSYEQSCNGVKKYYDKVVDQQYQQAGIKRQPVTGQIPSFDPITGKRQ